PVGDRGSLGGEAATVADRDSSVGDAVDVSCPLTRRKASALYTGDGPAGLTATGGADSGATSSADDARERFARRRRTWQRCSSCSTVTIRSPAPFIAVAISATAARS